MASPQITAHRQECLCHWRRRGTGDVAEFGSEWSDFFCEGNLRAILSRRRGTNDEWAVKVFNSSVENRVEKDYCESKTAEKMGVMHFAQVVCSFHCRQKIVTQAFNAGV